MFPQLIFKILIGQKDILVGAESIKIPPPPPPFKPFEAKDSAKKSKAIVIPLVDDTSNPASDGSNVGGLANELTKIRKRLDNIEADQKIILATLEKTV